jgi:hypothetical protein
MKKRAEKEQIRDTTINESKEPSHQTLPCDRQRSIGGEAMSLGVGCSSDISSTGQIRFICFGLGTAAAARLA